MSRRNSPIFRYCTINNSVPLTLLLMTKNHRSPGGSVFLHVPSFFQYVILSLPSIKSIIISVFVSRSFWVSSSIINQRYPKPLLLVFRRFVSSLLFYTLFQGSTHSVRGSGQLWSFSHIRYPVVLPVSLPRPERRSYSNRNSRPFPSYPSHFP